ncbi:MAG: shikimate kinase [Oscillospiraceae bacterium]|nr:shikimate kinase [Oscillospiraceae bacterium]
MDNIILIGMPGAGKSTAGILLAKALGFGFVDIDLMIQQQEGELLQQLLDRLGVEAFLDLESRVIERIACDRCVISPGGSAVCRANGMAHLQSLGVMVYLSLSLQTVQARIDNLTTRGIAMLPGQTLRDVYASRTPLYAQYADHTIPVDGLTPAQTVAELLRLRG